jgi:hypothetical protein
VTSWKLIDLYSLRNLHLLVFASYCVAGLSLFDNLLTGTIPTQLQRLTGLENLYLDTNDLVGPVPVCDLNLVEFWTDCDEVKCSCCTTCCDDSLGCK